MLRVHGSRVLVAPITPPATGLVQLTDQTWPVAGRVVDVGTPHCPTCEAVVPTELTVGTIVIIPTGVGQELKVDGVPHWIVPIEDVVATWEPST